MAKKKRNEDKDMTKDFFEALDILEKERNISKDCNKHNITIFSKCPNSLFFHCSVGMAMF